MGHPRGESVTKIQKTPCPPCLGEALRRRSIIETTIFLYQMRTGLIRGFFDSANMLLNGLNAGFVLIFFDIDLLEGIMRCKQIFYLTTEIFCLAHDIKPS